MNHLIQLLHNTVRNLKKMLCRNYRGQSIPTVQTLLLTLILTTTFGVAAVGSDEILSEHADLSQEVMTDEFESFDRDVETTLDANERRRVTLEIPPGSFYATKSNTQITIDSGSKQVRINTTLFEFIPRGSNQIVTYESGLVTRRERPQGSPLISKYPREMYVDSSGGNAIYTLYLVEHNVNESAAIQPTLRRDFVYNVYPEISNRESHIYSAGDDVSVTVTSPNHEAWRKYFRGAEGTAASMYTNVDSNQSTAAPNTVKAEIKSNTRFRLKLDRVVMLHRVRQT